MLHFKYLRGLWISLCRSLHKFSIFILNQVKREHIPIKVRHFSLRKSSDEDSVFAGLKNFLLFHKFLSLLLNEFLQSEILQKSRSVQNVNSIITAAINYQVVCGVVFHLIFVVQINNFFSLVPFSIAIHKIRGKKLTRKTIKYKLDSSSKM